MTERVKMKNLLGNEWKYVISTAAINRCSSHAEIPQNKPSYESLSLQTDFFH